MAVAPSGPNQRATGLLLIGLASVVFLAPAGLLLFFGLRARRRVDRMGKLAALGAATVRLPIDLVASDLDVAPAEARQLILDAVGDGLLRARESPGDSRRSGSSSTPWATACCAGGVFFSAAAETTFQQGSVHCRRCGASAQVMLVPGEAATCPCCKSPV